MDCGKVNIWEKLTEDRSYFSKVCPEGLFRCSGSVSSGCFLSWSRREGMTLTKGKVLLLSRGGRTESSLCWLLLIPFTSRQASCESGYCGLAYSDPLHYTWGQLTNLAILRIRINLGIQRDPRDPEASEGAKCMSGHSLGPHLKPVHPLKVMLKCL